MLYFTCNQRKTFATFATEGNRLKTWQTMCCQAIKHEAAKSFTVMLDQSVTYNRINSISSCLLLTYTVVAQTADIQVLTNTLHSLNQLYTVKQKQRHFNFAERNCVKCGLMLITVSLLNSRMNCRIKSTILLQICSCDIWMFNCTTLQRSYWIPEQSRYLINNRK